MKKHIIRAVLFILIVLAADHSIYFVLSRVEAARSEAGSFNLLYSGLANFDVVFFGSSRTSLHINPKVIEAQTGHSSYNFGLEATNFDQHLFTAEEYLIQNRKPTVLVFEADLWSLYEGPLKFLNYIFKRFPYRSLHTFQLVNGPDAPTYAYYLGRLRDSILMSARFRNQVPDLVAGYINDRSAETKDEYFISGARLMKRAYVEDEKPIVLKVGPVSERRASALKTFLEQCRQKGIKTALLMSPYYRANEQIDRADHDRVYRVFKEIADSSDSLLLDYTYEPSLINEEAFFYNKNHLNRAGADVYSKLVGQRLSELFK